ncbi:MAG: hypothetical protein WDW36_006990 [Sanguina aurantia]
MRRLMELTWISFHGRPIAAAQMAKAGGASLLLGVLQAHDGQQRSLSAQKLGSSGVWLPLSTAATGLLLLLLQADEAGTGHVLCQPQAIRYG